MYKMLDIICLHIQLFIVGGLSDYLFMHISIPYFIFVMNKNSIFQKI